MYKRFLAIITLGLLSACSQSKIDGATVYDLGTVQSPYPGYALHGMAIAAHGNVDRIYVLEKDGIPVSGTSSRKSGKGNTTVTSVVPADVEAPAQ